MLITFDPRRVISPHFGIILIYCRAGIYKKKISILTRIEKVDFLVNSPYPKCIGYLGIVPKGFGYLGIVPKGFGYLGIAPKCFGYLGIVLKCFGYLGMIPRCFG